MAKSLFFGQKYYSSLVIFIFCDQLIKKKVIHIERKTISLHNSQPKFSHFLCLIFFINNESSRRHSLFNNMINRNKKNEKIPTFEEGEKHLKL
jgi:hypothetical protein